MDTTTTAPAPTTAAVHVTRARHMVAVMDAATLAGTDNGGASHVAYKRAWSDALAAGVAPEDLTDVARACQSQGWREYDMDAMGFTR